MKDIELTISGRRLTIKRPGRFADLTRLPIGVRAQLAGRRHDALARLRNFIGIARKMIAHGLWQGRLHHIADRALRDYEAAAGEVEAYEARCAARCPEAALQ